MHHTYSVIQVQLVLHRLYDGGNDEAEAVKDGIQVQPIQKFGRILVLRCERGDQYRHVEVDADLGKVVSQIDRECQL